MEKIILVGGGGHSRSCIDAIEKENKYSIAGIVDVKEKIGQMVFDYEVIGTDEDLSALVKKYGNCLVTLGSIGDTSKRRKLFEKLGLLGAKMPVIVSPFAVVSKRAEIGKGTVILHGALVNSGSRIGENCIINTGAIIEHDAVVGDHCHVSTGAVINGECEIGSGSFIGSNAVLKNNIRLVSNTVIGAGAVVLNSIEKPGIYAGNPAKELLK